jgi:hypothetical protein
LKTKENQKAYPATKHEVPDLDELRTKLWDILGRKLPLKLTESGGLKEGIGRRTPFARGIILDKLLIFMALSPHRPLSHQLANGMLVHEVAWCAFVFLRQNHGTKRRVRG